MAENKVASALGIDPNDSRQVPELLMAEAFFDKLAELGIQPQTQPESQQLWAMGEALDGQLRRVEEATRQPSNLDIAERILRKTASAPSNNGYSNMRSQIEAEAAEKTAAYVNNPIAFAHGLALLGEVAG